MKGLRDQHIGWLLRMVRARLGGGGMRTICDLAGVGRPHVSQMLNGRGTRGRDTWARVRRHLTAAEWCRVEQSATWNNFRARWPLIAAEVQQVPLCDDAQFPIMPVVCCVCHRGIGHKSCVREMAGKPSHSYCVPHFREMMAEAGMPAADVEQALSTVSP